MDLHYQTNYTTVNTHVRMYQYENKLYMFKVTDRNRHSNLCFTPVYVLDCFGTDDFKFGENRQNIATNNYHNNQQVSPPAFSISAFNKRVKLMILF